MVRAPSCGRAGPRLLAALAAGLALGAQAHPHGQLHCAAQWARAGDGAPVLDWRLTMDAATSATLLPRLGLPGEGGPPPDRAAIMFGQMLVGLFRQSDWMLQWRVATAAQTEPGPLLPLADDVAEPATLHRTDTGQVQLRVRLRPAADAPLPAGGWAVVASQQLRCQDPVWYWAAGFKTLSDVQVAAPCRAELGEPVPVASQARALQARAREAAVAQADQTAPGLLDSRDSSAPTAALHCPTG